MAWDFLWIRLLLIRFGDKDVELEANETNDPLPVSNPDKLVALRPESVISSSPRTVRDAHGFA